MTGGGYKYAPKPTRSKVRRSQSERALEALMDSRFKANLDKLFRPIARQGTQAADQVQDLRKAHSARNEELSKMFNKIDVAVADINARLDRIEKQRTDMK
jgi:hypothetical protein